MEEEEEKEEEEEEEEMNAYYTSALRCQLDSLRPVFLQYALENCSYPEDEEQSWKS